MTTESDTATGAADLSALQDRITDAALMHAAFDGWTDQALRAAARDAGASELDIYRAFPGGVEDLLDHHLLMADRRMVEDILALDLDTMKIREKITRAVRMRLEAAEPHKEAVRRGFNHLGLPHRGPRASRALWRTVDLIWRAIGDTSTDFNFYTKRTLLAGVYMSTLLFWLNDRSDDHADTWAFLDRRIANVMQIEKAKGKLLGSAVNPASPVQAMRRIGENVRRRRPFRA
ncbi:MAG: hypothetical protein DHS20C03_40280 [Minwuia thermotolerans]|nr:MAG: hypothetical protein DHS20C03_40280 [Minwuia thermotolerans]